MASKAERRNRKLEAEAAKNSPLPDTCRWRMQRWKWKQKRKRPKIHHFQTLCSEEIERASGLAETESVRSWEVRELGGPFRKYIQLGGHQSARRIET